MAYALLVGPVLGVKAVQLVPTRGEKRRALLGFFVGNAGLAWFVGAMVACTVTDACFH